MTKVAVLGASGLIGHRLFMDLSERFGEAHALLHGTRDRFARYGIFDGTNVTENVDARDLDATLAALEAVEPDVVLSCAGITKRRPEVNDPLQAITVNALFPHQLAHWAKGQGVRVIHFSTDCVFDGAEGDYTESSPTTGKDAYGQTKALGEIRYDHSLTIRSSFIGQELSVHSELLDWFLAQRGKTIKGFTNALYSGVSTREMARVIGDIIEHHPTLGGLYQLSVPDPISKFDLLGIAREAYDVDVEIIPDGDFVSKPTLDGSALRAAIGVEIPDWPQMMRGLAAERAFYAKGNSL